MTLYFELTVDFNSPDQPVFEYIAVGSTNPAKVGAAAHAVARAWPAARVRGVDVPSGVGAQPVTSRDGVRGALNRAVAARRALDADLGIGIEGYSEDHPFGMFTTAWVAVVDRAGRVGLGSTGRCPLPGAVAAGIRAGGELGPLIDALLGEQNTKQRGGASGAFTAGLVERTASLSYGVLYALAPFLSPQHFGPAGLASLDDISAALDADAALPTADLHYAYTLCFVQREDGAVLFLHRRHPPNLGRLNGLGGKVDPGEDLLAGAQREVLEESGLAIEPHLGGVISLWWPEVTAAGRGPVFLFLFRAAVDAATADAMPLTGSEGRLCWLDPAALTDYPVVTNIPVFLPPLLAQPPGAVFSGTFWYTADWGAAEYVLHLPTGPVHGLIGERHIGS